MEIAKYNEMMSYLTRNNLKDRVKFASDLDQPIPKKSIVELEAFNRFNRDNPNPRTEKSNGGELIVEPSESMQVDTTTSNPAPEFDLRDFRNKAEIFVLAHNNRALPREDIILKLNSLAKQGIDAGTFTMEEAADVVKELKFEVQDRAQKQRLRDNIIAGTGTLSREDFSKGSREDLAFENITRLENAKINQVPTRNASAFRALPGYDNITYTDFKNKETGEIIRKYNVRVRVQDKNVQKIGTTADKYKNIDSLDKAIKLRDDFRKANPKNIKPLDKEKQKITKDTRRADIKTRGGVEDFLVAEEGSGVQKGHAQNIKNPDVKIKPSNIIYTPTAINEAMAGKGDVKELDLDFKIREAEDKIKKIKNSRASAKAKKKLLAEQDTLLKKYVAQSDGFKTVTLSDGNVYGEVFQKTKSMDMFDVFPNMTEKETKTFVRQYITEKGDLKPFYKRKVKEGTLSDVDKANIQKSKIFLENVELAKQNAKRLGKIKNTIKDSKIRSKMTGPELDANRALFKGIGETLKAIPTPAGTLALTAGFGVDPTSTIDRVALEAEAALAPELVKQTSRLTSNPIVQRFFNLGLSPANAMRVARVAQPLGIASLVGEGLYELGKRGVAEKAKIDAMTPFQKQQYLAGEVEPLMDEGGMVDISRDGFAVGGLASLFKKAAQVSDALRKVKNATFEMFNNVRMFGNQKGIEKNLEGFTNIPDKNRKLSSLEDIQTLKESVPEKYHQDLDIMMKSVEQDNFETAFKQYEKFEKDLDPSLKFENIPEEYFPMLDPTNEAFVITGPRESFKAPRYSFRTSMELDPKTKKPTGKYQTEKLEIFDPETGTFREEGKVVGVTTEKGKEGLN